VVDFAALFQRSPNPYMVVDRGLRYLAANDAYAAILDTTPDALVGRALFDVFPGQLDDQGRPQADPVRDSIERVFRTGQADHLALVPYSVVLDTPGGPAMEERFWSATHTPLFDEDGTAYAVLQHTTDVTDVQRTRAELEATRRSSRNTPEQLQGGLLSRARAVQESNRALEAQRGHLMSLFAQAPGYMAVLRGHEYRFEIANAAYEELIGGRQILVGQKLTDVLPEIEGQGYLELLDQVRGTGRRFLGRGMAVQIVGPDGQPQQRYVDFIYQPIVEPDGRVDAIFVQGADVTDREAALAALRESEQRFRTIAEMLPQMIWSTLPDGYHDYYNRQWYAFTGVPEGSTDGEAWNGMFHPDDQARAWGRWRHSLETGEPYEIEYRLRHASGEYRWVLGRALPIRDVDGAIVRWMGTCTEIHEQRMARDALEAGQRALREADRRKDHFLAILAHELRNPLAPIGMAASLLRMSTHDPVRVREASEIIDRQARHMTELVNDLLDVSRVTRGLAVLDKRPMDLVDAVRAAVEQASPLLARRRHALRVMLPDGPVPMEGDALRLTQAVANLLANAAKYTPPGGHVDVEVSVRESRACVEVRDDGIGMDAALLPSVFELFTQAEATPERSEGGLGIGLSLVRSLVQLHGGTVEAESPGLGQGATFRMCVPCTVSVTA
jgi:PAS domain S-box-containing protein